MDIFAEATEAVKKETAVTLTIGEDGTATFLKTDSAGVFLETGAVTTRRASHVEPAIQLERIVFHVLRTVFGDKGRVSDWTRSWKTLWRVNTAPVGGPILCHKHTMPECVGQPWFDTGLGERWAVWGVRQNAIDAEIKFLDNYFAERKQQ